VSEIRFALGAGKGGKAKCFHIHTRWTWNPRLQAWPSHQDERQAPRRADGKVKIVKKHETPTRVGGVLGGGVGLATGLVVALFPFAAIGGGLLAGTTAGGAVLGSVTGHAVAGMSRNDLKELGEQLDKGQAGLLVVGVSDVGAKIESAMHNAEKVEQKEMKADNAAIEADAKSA